MIPVSVSDILKILDQIPIWKALVGLPKRLADLEARVAALEKSAVDSLPPAKPVPEARICPICSSVMDVVKEKPHPFMSAVGLKVHDMKCPGCGAEVERDFDGRKYS